MEKRTYLADTIAMALLYRKQYVESEMLSYDQAIEFDRIINENLEAMNSSCRIGIRYDGYDTSDLFVKMTDENGKLYCVIVPGADLEKAWHFHIGCLPTDVLIAAQMPNALQLINLELVDGKLKNKLKDNVVKEEVTDSKANIAKVKRK